MARLTDPRAAGFDPAAFRDGIKFAMRMGAPDAANERVTFRWLDQPAYTTHDPAGRSYDWTTPPTSTVTVADLQLDCAVELLGGPSGETNIGTFDANKMVITLLDDDYEALIAHGARLPDVVLAGGNTYLVQYLAPPVGLFDVTVYRLFTESRDES